MLHPPHPLKLSDPRTQVGFRCSLLPVGMGRDSGLSKLRNSRPPELCKVVRVFRPISRLPHRLATGANFPRDCEIHLLMEAFDCQSVLAEVPDRWREMRRALRTPAWRYRLLACDPFHVLRRGAR